jgi:hypothetical protein
MPIGYVDPLEDEMRPPLVKEISEELPIAAAPIDWDTT